MTKIDHAVANAVDFKKLSKNSKNTNFNPSFFSLTFDSEGRVRVPETDDTYSTVYVA